MDPRIGIVNVKIALALGSTGPDSVQKLRKLCVGHWRPVNEKFAESDSMLWLFILWTVVAPHNK
jgi:hypothetical protein